MTKSFGDRLKEARANRSRAEIANIFGVTVSTLGNWERGDKEPNIATIGCMCREFGVTADWLLGVETSAAPFQHQQKQHSAADGESHWRDLAISQQATIAKLTTLLAEGRPSTPAAPVQTGGRSVQKTA